VIVVDTSALMAILKGEPRSDACIAILARESQTLVSAGTMAEALVVSSSRGVGEEMRVLCEGYGFNVVSVTALTAARVSDAYARWGRGFHRASLNFGDCFAYALAKEWNCPLLFVGGDFSATDIVPALPKS
jgi:ribonuclease VapC